jgi:hypothetical protein
MMLLMPPDTAPPAIASPLRFVIERRILAPKEIVRIRVTPETFGARACLLLDICLVLASQLVDLHVKSIRTDQLEHVVEAPPPWTGIPAFAFVVGDPSKLLCFGSIERLSPEMNVVVREACADPHRGSRHRCPLHAVFETEVIIDVENLGTEPRTLRGWLEIERLS